MGSFLNLYPVIAAGSRQVKISKRGREAVMALDQEGQLDHDKLRQPIVLRVMQNHGLDQVYVMRNRTIQMITISPHGKGAPQVTWNANDGYRRPAPSPLKPERNTEGARRERQRRNIFSKNPYMDSVLGGSNE